MLLLLAMSLTLQFALSLLKVGSLLSQTFFLDVPFRHAQYHLPFSFWFGCPQLADMLCNFCVNFSQWLTIIIISVLAFLGAYVDVYVCVYACMCMYMYKHAYLM